MHNIVSSAGQGGTISPSGEEFVQAGENKEYTITAFEGYVILDVKVDGNSVGAVTTYTFEDVQASHTIEAIFIPDESNPDTGVPETGDNTNPTLWLMIALVSIGGLSVILTYKRKGRRAEK